jgi:hypothetical protein
VGLQLAPRVFVGIAARLVAVPVGAHGGHGPDVLLTEGSEEPPGWVRATDVEGTVEAFGSTCARAPLAAGALARLLRLTAGSSAAAAAAAESATYSTLLAGPEFMHWLGTRSGTGPSRAGPSAPTVLVEEYGGRFDLVLNRPDVHNAFNTAMRDELVGALRGTLSLPGSPEVRLRGAGPSFCSGGDLSEFGTAPDAASADAVRLARHPGLLLRRLGHRATAVLHGACVGAGIELAAFCSRVEAAGDTHIRLPELQMGLVPGAGGTVSIPRRIGARRTAFLALSGSTLDIDTALRWGLVDGLAKGPGPPG